MNEGQSKIPPPLPKEPWYIRDFSTRVMCVLGGIAALGWYTLFAWLQGPDPTAFNMWFFLGIPVYFLPTIIALVRGQRSHWLPDLNLWFGWTGVVWLVCLVWALYPKRRASSP